MSRVAINTGAIANDGTGDTLRSAGGIINSNFLEIYTRFGDGTNLTSIGGTWAVTSVGIHTLKNVGIGTTNPTSTLTVDGNGTFTGVVTATTFIGALTGAASTATLATNAQGLTGTPDITVGVVTASRLNVGTSGTVITTTSSGLVGIGTTNPRFILEVGAVGASGTTLFVNGDARITGIVTIGTSSITLNGSSNTINVGTGITIDGSTGIISATSIVLGGTTLTGAAVTSITAGSGISVDQNTGNVTITATGGGGSGESYWTSTNAGIHTLSNVGIGTTNPTSALTVKGNTSLETLNVSGVSTFTGNVSFGSSALFGYNKIIFGSGNSLEIGHSGGGAQIYNFGGGKLALQSSDEIEFRTPTGFYARFTENYGALLYDNNNQIRLQTLGVGVTVTGTTFTNQLNVSGIATARQFSGYRALVGTASSTTETFIVTVASKTSDHRYFGSGSGSGYYIDGRESPFIALLPGKTYRFDQADASNSSHPLRFYLDANRTTQYTTNVTTNGTAGNAGAYTEITLVDQVPLVLHYQCSNHALMGNAVQTNSNFITTPYSITTLGNLSVSGVCTLSSNVSVGGTISIDGGVTLATNNATIVGTGGTTGEIKRIGGAPFFYDGSAWREFVLSSGTPVSVPADTEWDSVVLRTTFDDNFTDAKFGATPILVSAGATIVGSPVKIGTGALRIDGSVAGAGVSYAYRSDYDFTGSWTIEFWIYHDSIPPTGYYTSLITQSSSTNDTGDWSFGYANNGSVVTWIWDNENSTQSILHSASSATFNSIFLDKWVHYALVREGNNGSIHFYIDGVEKSDTINNAIIDNNILHINGAGLGFGAAFGQSQPSINGNTWNFFTVDAIFDDVRISCGVGTAGQRYTSVGIATTATFTPPTTALPTTGTLSSYVQPPGDKYGEITLGGSPTWRGTSGVTVSQQSSGNYRVSFASSYTNANDYYVLSQGMDQGFASYVGIARSTTHVDLAINKQSDDTAVDTGALAVQIKNHI
jgi:hypothetical protein